MANSNESLSGAGPDVGPWGSMDPNGSKTNWESLENAQQGNPEAPPNTEDTSEIAVADAPGSNSTQAPEKKSEPLFDYRAQVLNDIRDNYSRIVHAKVPDLSNSDPVGAMEWMARELYSGQDSNITEFRRVILSCYEKMGILNAKNTDPKEAATVYNAFRGYLFEAINLANKARRKNNAISVREGEARRWEDEAGRKAEGYTYGRTDRNYNGYGPTSKLTK